MTSNYAWSGIAPASPRASSVVLEHSSSLYDQLQGPPSRHIYIACDGGRWFPSPMPAHRRGCLLECHHLPYGGHDTTIAVCGVSAECTYWEDQHETSHRCWLLCPARILFPECVEHFIPPAHILHDLCPMLVEFVHITTLHRCGPFMGLQQQEAPLTFHIAFTYLFCGICSLLRNNVCVKVNLFWATYCILPAMLC